MDKRRSKNASEPKIFGFINSMNRICLSTFIISLLITLFELCIIACCIHAEISRGSTPIFAVYIPLIKEVLLFTVLCAFFSFLFDSLMRDAIEN